MSTSRRAKTSITHPIGVDFLPLGSSVAGRLVLTLCPGKKAPDAYRGAWDRDLSLDLPRLREHHRAERLVTLIEPHEFDLLRVPDLLERAAALGLATLWTPIPDGCAPRSAAALKPTVRAIVEDLRAGRTVVVHCRGGLGRAGTVSACVLVALGSSVTDAIGTVRTARPGAIETLSQERFIEGFVAPARRGRARSKASRPPQV